MTELRCAWSCKGSRRKDARRLLAKLVVNCPFRFTQTTLIKVNYPFMSTTWQSETGVIASTHSSLLQGSEPPTMLSGAHSTDSKTG
jgi:hypothetical protein